MEKLSLGISCGSVGFILGWALREWLALRRSEWQERKKREMEERCAWLLYEAQKTVHHDGPPPRPPQPRIRLNG